MALRWTLTGSAFWRSVVQWGFLSWILYIGVKFGLFVHHFETKGVAAYHNRPPGVEGFLPMDAPLHRKTLPRWVFPVLVLAIYTGGVTIGMATGHWETSLTYQDYQQLIPMTEYLNH